MTFHIGLNKVVNGEYQTILNQDDCNIVLNIDSGSFSEYLSILFQEMPNDFRYVVYDYIVDCAFEYLEKHPISEEERDRFFDLLDKISEEEIGPNSGRTAAI